jgi:hypothetical protein
MYELKGEPTPLGREDDTGGMYQQRYQKLMFQHRQAAVSEAAVQCRQACVSSCSNTDRHVSAAGSEAALPTQTGSFTRSSCTNADRHVSAAVSEAAVPTQTAVPTTALKLLLHNVHVPYVSTLA